MDRRDFLKLTGKTVAAIGMSEMILEMLLSNLRTTAFAATSQEPVVIVLQLSGGNDGLNTIIPYTSGVYYDQRPTLFYKQSDVLAINDQIGFHPSLKGMKKIFDENNLAIIQGVGYPKPDHSHFRSQEIWQTGVSEQIERTGWLGRYLDITNADKYPLRGLSVGSSSKIFLAKNNEVPTIGNPQSFKFLMNGLSKEEQNRRNAFFQNMYDNASEENLKAVGQKGIAAIKSSIELNGNVIYKKNDNPYHDSLGTQLSFIAQCISSNLATKTYFLQAGGFDDHQDEKQQQGEILSNLDDNLSAFYQDLKQRNILDRVVLVIHSEFGRRVAENASGGTDHGTAASVFVIGGNVHGGVYGDHPDMTKLDDGDLRYLIDFRSVYGTILDNWLHVPSKDIFFGKNFENLNFI